MRPECFRLATLGLPLPQTPTHDPLFLFPELDRTFGELTPAEKLRYSHRGRAFRAMLGWLSQQQIS